MRGFRVVSIQPGIDPGVVQAAFFEQNPTLLEPIELMAAPPRVGVFVKNPESRYVYNNDFHRIRYDRIKAGELIGKCARERFPALSGDAYEANDRADFEEGKSVAHEGIGKCWRRSIPQGSCVRPARRNRVLFDLNAHSTSGPLVATLNPHHARPAW